MTAVGSAYRFAEAAVANRLEAIQMGRNLGLSWVQIGKACGISRQAAQRRFASQVTEPDPELVAGTQRLERVARGESGDENQPPQYRRRAVAADGDGDADIDGRDPTLLRLEEPSLVPDVAAQRFRAFAERIENRAKLYDAERVDITVTCVFHD